MHVYRRKLHTIIQASFDALSLWFIWRWTTELRLQLNPFTELTLSREQAAGWMPSIALVLVLWAAVSVRLRLYRSPDPIQLKSVLRWALLNTIAVGAVTVLATFFSRQFGAGTSRSFVLCLLPVAFAALVLTRCLALATVAALQYRRETPRLLIICDTDQAERFMSSLELQVAKTIRGVIVPEGPLSAAGVPSIPVLGTTGQLAEVVNRERIDQAILLTRSLPDAELEHCRKVLWRMGLPLSYALDLSRSPQKHAAGGQVKPRLQLSRQYGLPTVEVRAFAFDRSQDSVKRSFDVVLSCLLLVALFPLLLLIGALVKLTSPGPLLKRSLHVGKGGRHFNSVRFRTTAGPDSIVVTAIGQLLLRYRADELPQLLNILRGRMTFVGPAPLSVPVLERGAFRQELMACFDRRSLVPPGLTGPWQICRNALSFDEMLCSDLAYVQGRSMVMDIAIICRTPASVLRGVRAPEDAQFAFDLVADAS